jgi:hypothetical protein
MSIDLPAALEAMAAISLYRGDDLERITQAIDDVYNLVLDCVAVPQERDAQGKRGSE